MMKKSNLLLVSLLAVPLAGCVNPGDQYRPDVYDASEVNRVQVGSVVQIISVQPVKVRVNNEANQNTATVLSSLGTAALGAGLGTAFGGTWGGVGGGLGGAALGATAGGLATNRMALVDGVTIFYQTQGGQTSLAATEVGRYCQWHPGYAQLVMTARGQTRILPNASCPPK